MKKLVLNLTRYNFNLLSILLFAFILRLINLNQSFWLDEAAQVIESIRPLSEQFQLAADFHPPMFHLILHFWLYIGQSEIWVRLLPVALGTFSVAVIFKLTKTISDSKTGYIATILLATSAYHVWYSQEARPYILFLLLSLLSTLYLIQKKWVLFTIAILFTLYTNYFAVFLIMGLLAYAIFIQPSNLRKILTSLFFAFVLFLPWLPEFMLQLRTGTSGVFAGWSSVVSEEPVKAVLLTFAKFSIGKLSFSRNPLYIALLLPVLAIFIYSVWELYKDLKYRFLLILLFVPLTGAFLASFLVPVLAPQRLIFLLPVIIMILSIGIMRLKSYFRYIFLIIILIANLSGVINYYTDPYTQREQWRQAIDFIEKSEINQSIALFAFPDPFAPYLWYSKNKVIGYGIAPEFNLKQSGLNYIGNLIEGKSRIYHFQYLTELTDPQNYTRKYIESAGYQNNITRDFPGVGFVYVYDKE